jgi:hypothetical protein
VSAPPDHLATVAALRQLRGLPVHQQIAEPVAAIDVLHRSTRAWSAFTPRPAALAAAIVQADAIARSLRELRGALHAVQAEGGPADGVV